MGYATAVAIGIIAAIIVFVIFSGYLVVPIKAINSSLTPFIKTENASSAKQFFPVSFALKGDQPYRVVYATDERNNMKVYMYWYVWNHDANQKRDDPEPVFVYYQGSFGAPANGGGSIFAIAHRTHYQWTVKYDAIITQGSGNNPVITFTMSSHTPANSYPLEPSKYEPVKLDPTQQPQSSIRYQGSNQDPWTIVDMTSTLEHSTLYALAGGAGALIVSAAVVRSRRNKVSYRGHTVA